MMPLAACKVNRLAKHQTSFDFGELMCKTITGDISRSTDRNLLEQYGTLTSYVYVKQLPEYFNNVESNDILKKYLEKQNSIDFLATVSLLCLTEDEKVLVYDLPQGEMLREYIKRKAITMDYHQVSFLLIKLKDMIEQLALVDMQHGRIEIDSIYISKEGHLYLLDSAIVAAKHELITQEIIPFRAVPNYEAITASPEVCFGRDVATQDNVFNLSLLAYQLIYNSHPYDGENSVQALIRKCRAIRLESMSDCQWAVFRQGLSFHSANRFASLSELIEALLCVNNPDGLKFQLLENRRPTLINAWHVLNNVIKNKLSLMLPATMGQAFKR